MRKLLLGAAVLLALLLAYVLFPMFMGGMQRWQHGRSGGNSTAEAGSVPTPGKKVSQYTLSGLWVMAMAYDGQGNLWLGTEDAGLYVMSADRRTCLQVTTAEGLGDMSVYALAVDAGGRVWAGHRASGVSVLEGGAWKNYNMVNGPLGHRVFDIAANPSSGDVWIATDCGVTQYVAAAAKWRQYTTTDGLPSNAAYRVAIADDDTVVVGMQADGLAVAQAADGYKEWRHIDGPARAPLAATGEGLPSCQINDLAIGGGSIWVATPFGIAHARLADLAFTFWRGADWEEKAALAEKAAAAVEQPMPALLREDYVTRLELMADGQLAIGYRQQGIETLAAKQLLQGDTAANVAMRASGGLVTALALNPAGELTVGAYGRGVTLPPKGGAAAPVAALQVLPAVQGAVALTLAELEANMQRPGQITGSVAAFMGDDWATQGDTTNHYGRQLIFLPWTGSSSWMDYYKVDVRAGGESVYMYFPDIAQNDRRYLFKLTEGKRVQGEWNDGSWQEKYSPEADGPNMWFDVTVPEGVHRVSLMFINNDGHDGRNANRDYFLEVKEHRGSIAEAEALPSLARARVVNFYMPVLKQFALSGGRYYIKVTRQHSHVTKCSAVFIDRLSGTPGQRESGFAPFMDVSKEYVPQTLTSDTTPAGRAIAAWDATVGGPLSSASATALIAQRTGIYRSAIANGATEEVLSAMRWELPLVTTADRERFDAAMAAAHALHLAAHPVKVGVK